MAKLIIRKRNEIDRNEKRRLALGTGGILKRANLASMERRGRRIC
jgi:hypothetical protein